jgi:hypothetical protein
VNVHIKNSDPPARSMWLATALLFAVFGQAHFSDEEWAKGMESSQELADMAAKVKLYTLSFSVQPTERVHIIVFADVI